MTFTHEALVGDVQLVGVAGRLDQNQTPELETMLLDLLEKGFNRFIVDLSQTVYVNSGGLRCLVSAWRMAKNAGGDLVLCEMPPRVRQVFNIVGFDKVFHIFPTCVAAREHWQAG